MNYPSRMHKSLIESSFFAPRGRHRIYELGHADRAAVSEPLRQADRRDRRSGFRQRARWCTACFPGSS